MFHAAVETDVGDRLQLILPDGRIGGKGILSFITAVSAYCAGTNEEDLRIELSNWFTRLEEYSKESICHRTQILMQSFYSGEWDYGEDEYQLFIRRFPLDRISEEQFQNTIQQIKQKWVEVRGLLAEVNDLSLALRQARIENTWWYEAGETEIDFDALSQTLSFAVERKAERVRIKFS